MVRHTILAEFHDYSAAHRAFSELLQCGVEPDRITIIAGDRSDRQGASRDFGILARDAERYLVAIRRGMTLLAVETDERQRLHIVELISRHSPSEIEEGRYTEAPAS